MKQGVDLVIMKIFTVLILFCSVMFSVLGATNVTITVQQEPHLSGTFEVSKEGFIDYYSLGMINVKGKSPVEIEEIVKERILKIYPFMDSPVVKVAIEETKKSATGQTPETQNYFDSNFERFSGGLRPTYRISPHDQLAISVFGEENLSKEVRVSEDGTISYPLIGSVYVQDLSVEEATRKIEQLLEENYFVNPQVSLLIIEYSKFSVLGEVNRPGTFELKGALTVVDALVLAEGPKDSADLTAIKVIRSLRGDAQRIEEITVDFDKEGRAFYLKPLDRIVVNPKGKIYILGEVRNPGMYYITEKEISVSDAIAFFANGLKANADKSSIEISRKEGDQDKVYKIDLETQGRGFILRAQDRITVPEYGKISIFGQVRKPGRYPFKEGLTVIDAIALAEGFTDVAAQNSVKVIRKDTSQERAIRVPVGYILKSGDTSRDVELFDGDSVVVPESWF
jgi:polysaccharide biosynthesis/export protein